MQSLVSCFSCSKQYTTSFCIEVSCKKRRLCSICAKAHQQDKHEIISLENKAKLEQYSLLKHINPQKKKYISMNLENNVKSFQSTINKLESIQGRVKQLKQDLMKKQNQLQFVKQIIEEQNIGQEKLKLLRDPSLQSSVETRIALELKTLRNENFSNPIFYNNICDFIGSQITYLRQKMYKENTDQIDQMIKKTQNLSPFSPNFIPNFKKWQMQRRIGDIKQNQQLIRQFFKKYYDKIQAKVQIQTQKGVIWKKLQGPSDEWITGGKFLQIKDLSIRDINFETIPNQIGYLLGLNKLSIIKCQLTTVHNLENLIDLKQLYIPNNKITSLEGLQSLQNLQILSAPGNLLTSLRSTQNIKNLKRLYIQRNPVNLNNPEQIQYKQQLIRRQVRVL